MGLQWHTFNNGKIIHAENQKGTLDSNVTIDQMGKTDIYRTFHTKGEPPMECEKIFCKPHI